MLNTDRLNDIKTAIVISDYQTSDVIHLNRYAHETILLTEDGRQLRFDTISPLIGDDGNSDSLYTSLFE